MRLRLPAVKAALLTVALVTGCSGAQDDEPAPSPSTTASPTPTATTPAPSPTATTAAPPPASRIREVPPAQWDAIVAAGMVRPECPIQRREQLRRKTKMAR